MRKIVILVALLTLAYVGHAQVIDKPKDVAADDAASRANSNENSVIDNGLGKTEGAIKGLFKKKKKPADTAGMRKPVATTANTNMPGQSGGASISAYNNYDFIPGDQIIFADDFSDDQNGEFPAHWNLGAGQAVINTVAGKPALLLTDGNYAHVSPLIKSPSYLTDNFTIEFDSYSTGGYQPHIYLYASNANATSASSVLGHIAVGDHNGWGGIEYISDANGGVDLQGAFPAAIESSAYLGKWHHIAMAFKKNQLKIYVDQYRILVVPNIGIAPHAFDIEGAGDANTPIIMANFRVANGGGMNMLGKKFTDAKIVTHGINFDIDKATIKPESMGTLNMVAGVLRDNPEIKFEIDGHTDNTGTPAHNAMLSQQRADAVKAQLVTMGVDASRLTTKGFGDTKPIAGNDSPEGKANNRRVEFVKQ